MATLDGGCGRLHHSAAGWHTARLAPLTHRSNLHESQGRARRGFVLRRWIRKADGAWDDAALTDGLADPRFFKKPVADMIGAAFIRSIRPKGIFCPGIR